MSRCAIPDCKAEGKPVILVKRTENGWFPTGWNICAEHCAYVNGEGTLLVLDDTPETDAWLSDPDSFTVLEVMLR